MLRIVGELANLAFFLSLDMQLMIMQLMIMQPHTNCIDELGFMKVCAIDMTCMQLYNAKSVSVSAAHLIV